MTFFKCEYFFDRPVPPNASFGTLKFEFWYKRPPLKQTLWGAFLIKFKEIITISDNFTANFKILSPYVGNKMNIKIEPNFEEYVNLEAAKFLVLFL